MMRRVEDFAVHSALSGTLTLVSIQRSTAEKFAAAMRRTLMRELPGTVVRALRIKGADHEFVCLPGVVEDGVEIVENFKRVLLTQTKGGPGRRYATIEASGPATVTAGQLSGIGVEVVNPDLIIATVNEGGRLELEVEVASGRGQEASRRSRGGGYIELDCRYSPIEQVRVEVEERDKEASLSLRVTTNGTVEPHSAVVEAADILAAQTSGEGTKSLCRLVVAAGVVSAPHPDPDESPREPRVMGKWEPALELPDLTEIYRLSFASFAPGRPADDRRQSGLQRILSDAFAAVPGVDFAGYVLGEPQQDPMDCVRLGTTYGVESRIRLREKSGNETEVVLAQQLPLMTARGTFVVAGVEKVVMACLVDAIESRSSRDDSGGTNDLAERRLILVGEQLERALIDSLTLDVSQGQKGGRYTFTELASSLDRFFNANPLVQRAETTNPLTLLCQLRRVVQNDAGKRPGYKPRDLHWSHFGRLCPVDTPEGGRIGLNLGLALFAQIDADGLLTTPYRRRKDGSIEYLNAADEAKRTVGDGQSGTAYLARYGGKTLARHRGEIVRRDPQTVDCTPTHSAQALAASASLIPFLANDDSNRALMGNNMQKQALPLLRPKRPLVGTGMEARIAGDSGAVLRSDFDGVAETVTAEEVVISAGDGQTQRYRLEGFFASPLGSCQRQRPRVRPGQSVVAGQLLADGPATDEGDLALGRNVLVGFVTWEGFNFEDAIVVSQRVVDDDLFTSIKVKEYVVRMRDEETGTLGAQHLPDAVTGQLSPTGIVREGSRVEGGDLLVAKSGIRGESERVDQSLRLPWGQAGTVISVEQYSAANGDALAVDVSQLVRLRVAVRRRLMVGDKLANRHGGKGVVGLILPEDEMPILPDGRTLEVLVSPVGLPSRMNFGQVLDTHAGLAAQALNCTIESPGFNGALAAEVEDLLEEANLPRNGMLQLRDGRNGRLFERESTVGYQYYMKLHHLAVDTVRSTLPSPDPGHETRGSRLGIMETWALQAHGAAHILKEMSTVQAADEVDGESATGAVDPTYHALVGGGDLPTPGATPAVGGLVQQLRGLCLDLRLHDGAGEVVEPDTPIDEIAETSVTFAEAETVAEWARGADLKDVASVAAYLENEQADSPAQIALAHPVQHPWRTMLGEGGEDAGEISRLPVLPRSLRNGSTLDGSYLAVAEANAGDAQGLQQAVDALMGDGLNRKGLTRLLHGKRGWFATAMTGRRVNYSGRAVIVPGPDLRQDECGLPRVIARSLFEPFVVGALLQSREAESVAVARHMIRTQDDGAERRLEQVAASRLVLLHRAPVLHRWGIQAFRPVLSDDEVLRLHPLTAVTFNADFDGDALGVFLPLSSAAQREAATMVPSANQVGSAAGTYAHGLTQEMVLGCYWATAAAIAAELREFENADGVVAAYDLGDLRTQDPVRWKEDGLARQSTVGRLIFNRLLPAGMEWVEEQVGKRRLEELLMACWLTDGSCVAARLADELMGFGFRMATRSGVSIGIETQSQYSAYEETLSAAWRRVDQLEGATEEAERKITEHWLEVVERMTEDALEEHVGKEGGHNPTYMMMHSGARSNANQLRQQIALRGLFSRTDGSLYSIPCTTTFVRGQSPFEFFSGVEGARRGLTDATLKSARAGFLFKRLMSAVQDVLIGEEDCGVDRGIEKRNLQAGDRQLRSMSIRIAGRYALQDVVLPGTQAPLVGAGELITREDAERIEAAGIAEVAVRSPIVCEAVDGVCSLCYGLNLSRWRPATRHLPVGVIAAQSLGEPLTQLTMRIFSLGGPGRGIPQTLGTIVSSLPGLEQLFEAGNVPGREGLPGREGSDLRVALSEMVKSDGAVSTGVYLLDEMLVHYRGMGVPIDDVHLELVIRQMLRSDRAETGVIHGVTDIARTGSDFMTATVSYNGVSALAKAAAQGGRMGLNAVGNATAFGKLIPARVPDAD